MRLQGEEGMGAVQHNTSPARGQTIREIVWFSQSFPFKNGDRRRRWWGAILSFYRRTDTTEYPGDSTPQSAPQTAPLSGEPMGLAVDQRPS